MLPVWVKRRRSCSSGVRDDRLYESISANRLESFQNLLGRQSAIGDSEGVDLTGPVAGSIRSFVTEDESLVYRPITEVAPDLIGA